MSERHRIKHAPVNIPEAVKRDYVNEKGFLEVSLNSKVPPIQDLLIKLYYYDYLYFIYHTGKNRMFYIQLVDYMQKCFSLTEDTIEGAVDEMYYYRLIDKKIVFNSRLLVLTIPSINFFGKNNKTNTSIGALLRTAFLVEHINTYEPEKREFYTQFIKENNFLLDGKLDYLKERYFCVPQKVVKNNNGEYLITFGLLDITQSNLPCDIARKIQIINSLFNPELDNVFFNLNFCCWDKERQRYIANKWKQQKDYLHINARHFKGIEFTNLNVRRFFDFHAPKKGGLNNVK